MYNTNFMNNKNIVYNKIINKYVLNYINLINKYNILLKLQNKTLITTFIIVYNIINKENIVDCKLSNLQSYINDKNYIIKYINIEFIKYIINISIDYTFYIFSVNKEYITYNFPIQCFKYIINKIINKEYHK